MESSNATARREVGQGGEVLPEDAAGLHAYWSRYSRGSLGMPREDFVSIVRTLIDNGRLNDLERQRLVALGWPELDT
jgi:hypothetical protein